MSPGLFLDGIVILLQIQVEDPHEFVEGIVREFNVLVKPAPKAGIAVDELFHRPRVASDDHDQVIPVILHGFQDRVDGFLTEVFLSGSQRVCLVDKQNSTQRFLDLLLGLQGSLPYIAGHKSGPVHLHQLSLRQDADLGIELGEDPGHRCLAGTGVSGEDQMKGYRHRLQPRILSCLLDPGKVRQLLHIMLDLLKADQGVECLHRILFGFLRCLCAVLPLGGLRLRLRTRVVVLGPCRRAVPAAGCLVS